MGRRRGNRRYLRQMDGESYEAFLVRLDERNARRRARKAEDAAAHRRHVAVNLAADRRRARAEADDAPSAKPGAAPVPDTNAPPMQVGSPRRLARVRASLEAVHARRAGASRASISPPPANGVSNGDSSDGESFMMRRKRLRLEAEARGETLPPLVNSVPARVPAARPLDAHTVAALRPWLLELVKQNVRMMLGRLMKKELFREQNIRDRKRPMEDLQKVRSCSRAN